MDIRRLALLVVLTIPFYPLAAVRADSVTGGYVFTDKSTISYLHLTQRGAVVTGYLQSLVANPQSSAGYTVVRSNLSGDLSGRSIELRPDGQYRGTPLFDGTWGNGRVALETPVNGFVARLTFSRTSAEKWNSIASRFITAQRATIAIRMKSAALSVEREQYLDALHLLADAKQHLRSAKELVSGSSITVKMLQAEVDKYQSATSGVPPTPGQSDGGPVVDASTPTQTVPGTDTSTDEAGDGAASEEESKSELNSAMQDLSDARQAVSKWEEIVSRLSARADFLHASLTNDTADSRSFLPRHSNGHNRATLNLR